MEAEDEEGLGTARPCRDVKTALRVLSSRDSRLKTQVSWNGRRQVVLRQHFEQHAVEGHPEAWLMLSAFLGK